MTDVKFDKDKTILIIYAHGSHGKERSKEKCTRKWNKVPPAIYQLEGTNITISQLEFIICFTV